MPSPIVWALVVWLAVINVATVLAFAADKRAARQGAWRTRERTLLLLELAGGFVGGWLAMRLLRHKTLHQSFRAMTIVAAVLWLGALGLVLIAGR